jgi:hypothetical protein
LNKGRGKKRLDQSIAWLDEPAPANLNGGPRRLSLSWQDRVDYGILQAEAQAMVLEMAPKTAK